MRSRTAVLIATTALALSVAGCSSSQPELATVRGQVLEHAQASTAGREQTLVIDLSDPVVGQPASYVGTDSSEMWFVVADCRDSAHNLVVGVVPLEEVTQVVRQDSEADLFASLLSESCSPSTPVSP